MAGLFQPDVQPQTLQSIFDLVGPGSAGQYFGDQTQARQDMNQINQNLSLADLSKAQEENRQAQIMNPMLAQIKGAEARKANLQGNDYWTQLLAGDQAESRSKISKAAVDEGTQVSRISATNSDNMHKQVVNLGENLRHAGSYVMTLPPELRHEALSAIAKDVGIPSLDNLSKIPPEQIGAALARMGDTLSKSDPKLINELQRTQETNAAHIKQTQITAAATVAAASMRQKDMKKEMETTWMKMDDNKKAGYIDSILQQASMDGETTVDIIGRTYNIPQAQQLAKHYTQRALANREAGAPKPQVPGLPYTSPSTELGGNLYPNGIKLQPGQLTDQQLLDKYSK